VSNPDLLSHRQAGRCIRDIFKQFIRVAPYPEDDVPWIVDNLGDDRCLVMGSDFPHAEGLADPTDFEGLLHPLGDDARRRIMRGNAEMLLPG
jgi:predicted TIM-barrel fold metal-dependent hydrolase